MKITLLLQTFPCLSETFILNQITGLIDLGCEVRIVAFSKSSGSKQHPDVSKYRLLEKTTYLQLPNSKSACRLKAAVWTLSAFIRHPCLIYRLQKMLIAKGRSYSYPQLFMAIEIIRQDTDIVLCHYGPTGQQAILLKKTGLKAKILTVFHGYDLSVYLNQHGTDVYEELFAKGDHFLPVSEFWKQKLIDLGCPPEKISVNHMGVNTAIFKPADSKKEHGKVKILTVARLTEKKGHRYALEAFRRVLSIFSQLEYHIAGDGPLIDDLKRLTRDWGIENDVIFYGKVNAEETLRLYKNADIFLLPSVTSSQGDMEGIPVSLMEAMACELPVTATIHSGIPELVNNGQTGYLVPERDADALAKVLKKLLEHPESWPQMGHAGREFVEHNYAIKELNKKLIGIFQKIIKRD